MHLVRGVIALVYIVATTIYGWILAFRMRRRLKRSLGIDASDLQLTSITTWMKADEMEKQQEASKPIVPQ